MVKGDLLSSFFFFSFLAFFPLESSLTRFPPFRLPLLLPLLRRRRLHGVAGLVPSRSGLEPSERAVRSITSAWLLLLRECVGADVEAAAAGRSGPAIFFVSERLFWPE